MKLEDLIQKYSCINCDATKQVVDKYAKIQNSAEAAIENALRNLEVERVRKQQLENDKIGKKRK